MVQIGQYPGSEGLRMVNIMVLEVFRMVISATTHGFRVVRIMV